MHLGLGEGSDIANLLLANLVTREGLLGNADWIQQQAIQTDISQRGGGDASTNPKTQALTDIPASLGWGLWPTLTYKVSER
jgi:hypothetical protein